MFCPNRRNVLITLGTLAAEESGRSTARLNSISADGWGQQTIGNTISLPISKEVRKTAGNRRECT